MARDVAKKFINDYLQRSIELFKDDALFFKEYKEVIRSLPEKGEYG